MSCINAITVITSASCLQSLKHGTSIFWSPALRANICVYTIVHVQGG